MARILVVFYSRTGNTRQVAAELAAALNADIEEIRDFDRRTGVWGYLRSGRQAFLRRLVSLAPALHKPETYDLVVVGTPIWNASLSAPVRSYLRQHRREIRAAAFFCTCGGLGIDRVFRQMSEETGQEPVSTVAIREAILDSDAMKRRVVTFARAITRAVTPTRRPVSIRGGSVAIHPRSVL